MLDFISEKASSWKKIKSSGLPVVVYGMGNGADKVIDEFEKLNIPVLGVTASDAFVRGQQFRGFTVKKLREFKGDYIIAVAFASCIPEVMNLIYSLYNERKVIVPVVPVFGNEIFNDEFVLKNKSAFLEAFSLFDPYSRKIFSGCVDFMFGGDLGILRSVTSEKDEVFRGFFKPSDNEYYLDLGAYRGDTVEELLHYSNGKYSEITALEPDRRTFEKLLKNTEHLDNFTALKKAVSSENGTAFFSSAAGRQSSLSEKGEQIETVTVDELFESKKVTYIKMDVEGAEREAILGAAQTLKFQKPKLNIALYHRSEDIFALPLLIKSINPDYEFHIRRHPYIPCWDMNLYCI